MDTKNRNKQLTTLFLILIDIVLLNLSALAAVLLRVEFDLQFAYPSQNLCSPPAP